MTDEPTTCALPGCSASIEQPADGGPPRRYCTPAHRAAARKQRNLTAHTDTEAEQAVPAAFTAPAAEQPPAPPSPPPSPRPAAEPVPEPLPSCQGPAHPWSAAASWLITQSPPPPPRPERPRGENRRAARSAGERKGAAVLLRRRAVVGIAVASLIAGGSGYIVTSTPVPVVPQAQPPAVPPPAVDAGQWAARAEVVLASITKQLDTVALTEASWARVPEAQRAGQPAALRALQERKALLEQQRVTLQSQINAIRALSDVTTDLTAAQEQLDAVERALRTAPQETTSPDQAETLRTLAAQREMHQQQRDYNVQELATLRSGVEEAVSSPLPDESDRTTPIVQQVLALIERRPDPRPLAKAPEQAPAVVPRRESTREERQTVSSTAPPDPSRPGSADRSTTDLAMVGPGSGRAAGNSALNTAVTNRVVTNNAVHTSGAVLRTAGHVVDSAQQAVTGRQSDSRGESNSGDRQERSADRSRPVSRLVSTVTGSVLGGSGGGRDDTRSSSTASSNRSSVGNAERGSGDAGSRSARADSSTGSTARRDHHQNGTGRTSGVAATPRGKAERVKDRAAKVVGGGARLLDPIVTDRGRSPATGATTGRGSTRPGTPATAEKPGRPTAAGKAATQGKGSSKAGTAGATDKKRATTPGSPTAQHRTGSSSTAQNDAQGKASRGKAGQGKAGQNTASQSTAGQNKAESKPAQKKTPQSKKAKTGPGSGNTATRRTSGAGKSDSGKGSSSTSGASAGNRSSGQG